MPAVIPEMLNHKALGRAIRAARENADLTLRELADRIGEGWTHADISKRENGRTRVLPSDLRAIARGLGVTVEDIEAHADVVAASEEESALRVARIPLVNYVPAGPAADFCEWGTTTHDAPETIDAGGLAGADLFAVRIRGESMNPKFFSQDVVVFRWMNPHQEGGHPPIRDGAIVFVRYVPEKDSLCTVGRWWLMPDGSIQIRKDNPRHATITLRREDIEQVGRFVQLRTEREE